MKATRSLLIGFAMFAVLVGGTAFAFASVGIGGSASHSMQIDFPSADGLVAGSDVLEAGAKVGYIQSIEPTQSNSALVTVAIDGAHWPVHSGATADIRPKSLLGEKYVDLHDGPASAPEYDTSRTLQASANADPVELDQFINSLDPATRTAVRVLLDDLGAGVAGRGQDLNAAIAAGKADLANLAVTGQTLNDRDPDLDKILVGLDGLLGKITTSDQLSQLTQLISNGQNLLNDIEQVQQPFSRQFTDANVALADLNTALGGAIPSLRSTIDIGPTLVANLQQETGLLAALACGTPGSVPASVQSCAHSHGVTSIDNLSPNGECSSANAGNTSPVDITSPGISGNFYRPPVCSPLWFLIKGLVQGPTVSGGGLELPTNNPVFRICLGGLPTTAANGACDNSSAGAGQQTGYYGAGNNDSATFAAWLGS